MRQDDDRRGGHVVAALNVHLVFVVPVVFRGLGWWRTPGDPQGVHPPAAHSWPAGL